MRGLMFGPCAFSLSRFVNGKQSLKSFVVGPPLDPVVQCQPGMTQA